MTAAPDEHKALIQQEFTKQAEAYAAAASVADPARVARLIAALEPDPEARVLDVATGPGHIALGLAAVCREVVGIDITEAIRAIAERTARERGLTNVRFERADADNLPFADGSFDIVVCRSAFHHFPEPPRVLAEMTRVCRVGGAVAVDDMAPSEHPARAAYQNRFEHLRDPSHTRAYPLSEMLGLFRAAGLEIEQVGSGRLTPEVEEWLARAYTPPAQAAETRALIEADERDDLSGCRPFRLDGKLHFTQHTAIVVGRKLP